MKRYSQYDEQTHILKAFTNPDGSIRKGRFLDIGAYNPFEFSNTRALFEHGWSGVMIEPSPGPMTSLVKEYGNEPRIQLVQAAVLDARGLVPPLLRLYVTDDCLSTIRKDHYDQWKDTKHFDGTIFVPVIDLPDIGNAWDFVNIDVEGFSADLFRHAIVDLGWRPHCFCVEHDSKQLILAHSAHLRHYSCVYENETNMVFVRNV